MVEEELQKGSVLAVDGVGVGVIISCVVVPDTIVVTVGVVVVVVVVVGSTQVR